MKMEMMMMMVMEMMMMTIITTIIIIINIINSRFGADIRQNKKNIVNCIHYVMYLV